MTHQMTHFLFERYEFKFTTQINNLLRSVITCMDFHPSTDLATYQIENYFYGFYKIFVCKIFLVFIVIFWRFRAFREQVQMHHHHHYKLRHIQADLV